MSTDKVQQITRPGLHTSPATIAAALRRVADDLDRLGDTQLSPVSITLDLQAVMYRGTFEERKATVDALAILLVGEPGETETVDSPHHRVGLVHREARGDLDVSVYTAVEDYRAGGAS